MKSTGTTGGGLKLYPMTAKRYKCNRCGHVVEQATNHYGPTWSFDRVGCCPKCPPWAKYGEFGGQTTWTCMEVEP
jgi:hypothetical protein